MLQSSNSRPQNESELNTSKPKSHASASFSWVHAGLAAFFLVAMGIIVGYSISRFQGLGSLGLSPADIGKMQDTLEANKTKITDLNNKINILTGERDATLLLSQNAKRTERSLQGEIESQQGIITLLESFAIKNGGVGLNATLFKVLPLPENAYEYKLDLFQAVNSPYNAKGSVEIRMVNDDKVYGVPMPEAIFNFKTRQTLVGRWTMPKGFIPKYIDVHVKGAGRDFEQRYAWRYGDVIPDMPETLVQYQEMLSGQVFDESVDATDTSPANTQVAAKPTNKQKKDDMTKKESESKTAKNGAEQKKSKNSTTQDTTDEQHKHQSISHNDTTPAQP